MTLSCPVVRELVRCHIPVAAICNAVNFLAENGFLDQRRHTGNTLPFLKSQAPHYKGEAYFVEAEAVCDNGILTANGFGALELAKEILRLLKFRSEQELAEWYAWNKFGLYSPGHKGAYPKRTVICPVSSGGRMGKAAGDKLLLKKGPG